MSYVVVAPPSEEPVSLELVKTHLKVDGTDEDIYLGSLIKAARMHVERYCKRTLVTTTLALRLDSFCSEIELLYGDFQSIASVKYLDSAGTEQTLDPANYVADLQSRYGRVKAVTSWPSSKSTLNAVTIEFVAGYSDASAVPEPIKHAMLLIIGRLYEQREDSVLKMPTASEYLLIPYMNY